MFLVRSLIGAESANFPFKIGEEIPNRRATIWKQYAGTKSGTSEAVSIFTLNKQASPDKVNLAKHFIQKLKILRYPHVLKFIDSVELTNVIHVVTEPVVPLDLNDLDAARGSSSTTDTAEDEKRDEGKAKILQVALGLHQIVSALSWLSNECKLVHGFLFPGSIYVTSSGDWKLSGFDIAYKHGDPLPDVTREFRQHLLPQQYRSPEFQKQDWSVLEKGPVWALDSWSLGCFIYEVFNGTFESPHVLTQPAQIPPQLLTDYKRLLSTNVNSRLNPSKVLENSFFDNELVKTVNFLDSLALKSNDEKNAFFTHFSKFVQNFPTATCKYKILPQLTHALDYGSGMSCFSAILTSVLKIGAMLTPEEFVEQVIPSVVKLFSSNERAVRVHLLQHMSEFGPHLTADLVNNQLFSHVITGFTDSSALLRELTVKSLTHFVSKLNSNNMDQVLRFLAKLQTDMEPAIRTNTTYCLAKIAPHVGASSREKILIPGLSKTLRDPFPPARVASLVAFLVTLEYHPAPVCARRIFPLVIPFACDPVKEVREACLRLCSAMMNKLTTASQEMGDVSDDGQQSQQPTQATTQGYGATPTDVSNAAANVLGYVGSWAINSIKNKMLGADDTPAGMVKSAMTVAAVSAYTASLTSPSTTAPSSRPAPSPSPSASSFSSSSTKPPATTTTASSADGWGDTNDDFFNDTAGDDTMVAALSIGKKKEKTEKPDKKSARREPAKPIAVVSFAGLDDDSGFGSAGWGDDDIPDVGGGDDDDWSASLSSSKPSSHNKTTSITINNDDDFFDSLTTTKPKPKSTITSTTVKPSTSTSSLSLGNKKKPVITSITSTSSSSTSKAADKDDWSFLND